MVCREALSICVLQKQNEVQVRWTILHQESAGSHAPVALRLIVGFLRLTSLAPATTYVFAPLQGFVLCYCAGLDCNQ